MFCLHQNHRPEVVFTMQFEVIRTSCEEYEFLLRIILDRSCIVVHYMWILLPVTINKD
jgi:hypothetical protein